MQGFFAEAGLSVSFISPQIDGYKTTPAQRVVAGEALLAVTPKESVVSFATAPPSKKAAHPDLVAVATINQSDTSAIATLKSSGIDRPSKLEGKAYGSYAARYEGRIVREMIKNDGGSGDYKEVVLPMLDLWPALLDGKVRRNRGGRLGRARQVARGDPRVGRIPSAQDLSGPGGAGQPSPI